MMLSRRSVRGFNSCHIVNLEKRLLCVSTTTTTTTSWCPPDLLPFIEGRGRRERKDSVTLEILNQRKRHREKMDDIGADDTEVRRLDAEGFGSKLRLYGNYSFTPNFETFAGESKSSLDKKSLVGAGGHAIHMGSACRDWPIFKHLLPEIAFAGHSNSGKSTLVNSLIGVLPKSGPAKVSDRAGWTDQICFYQLGRKPPILTLADLPGYGHAVASEQDKKVWTSMMKDFLKNRKVLSLCCILVDSTRGLCSQDKMLLRWLSKERRPWLVVLTKADLLSAKDLFKSAIIVDKEISPYKPVQRSTPKRSPIPTESSDEASDVGAAPLQPFRYGDLSSFVWPVSSSTGAGINNLWNRLLSDAVADSTPFINDRSVREHKLAGLERQRLSLEKNIPVTALRLSNRVRRSIK